MPETGSDIRRVELGPDFYREHKEGRRRSDFGHDNTNELLEGAFGLYSTVDLKPELGPIRTEFFRIALFRRGGLRVSVGLETFHPERDSLVFGFPGQIFSLADPTPDLFAYYMLFREGFMPEHALQRDAHERFPFYTYTGQQSFRLEPDEAEEAENLIAKINGEIRRRHHDCARAIRLYIELILTIANRSYERQKLGAEEGGTTGNALFRRYVRLVGRHFLTHRRVADYAAMLSVTADHLNRTVRTHAKKTAGALIDEMLLIEAKASLLHTDLTVAEIAYSLGFTDPSHFNKFFRKLAGCTPLRFRTGS